MYTADSISATIMHVIDGTNAPVAGNLRGDIINIVHAMDDEQILAALTLLRQLQKAEEP